MRAVGLTANSDEMTGALASQRITAAVICAVIAAITIAVYAPVRHFEFLNYDDNDYVSDNSHVLSGLTRKNAVWALAHFHASNWHPITWISHMADIELWGVNAGRHHITNVLFHTGSSIVLFALLISA